MTFDILQLEKEISEIIFTRSLKLLSSLKLVTNSLRNTITRVLLDNEKNNWKLHAWDSHRSISSFFKPRQAVTSHKISLVSPCFSFIFSKLSQAYEWLEKLLPLVVDNLIWRLNTTFHNGQAFSFNWIYFLNISTIMIFPVCVPSNPIIFK